MKTYTEKAKILPVIGEYDVIVTGGGPAGVAAALSAARNGAKTILIEQFNCIGGMATAGMMSHWSGGSESPITDEIMKRAFKKQSALYAENQEPNRWVLPHEMVKSVLFEMLEEAGVTLRLYTLACDAIMEENRITGVVLESKSGREAIFGKIVIDCSGDGDIAAKAGAEFQYGRENDEVCQPVTLMFRIGGVDYTKAIFPGSFESYIQIAKGEIQALGKKILPFPAGHVLLYRTVIPGEVCVNMTNVTDIRGTSADDLTRAEQICRKQMDAIVLFLREYVEGYESCYIVASAQQMGVRETRHFKGLYTITPEDILEATVFEDWIATRNHFNFDIHNTKGAGLDENGCQAHFKSKGRYTIPYRCCVPEKIDGLLLAGRNISGTHKAHSNYRVMPICANMGYGVGTAAAVAVKENILPRNVDVKKVQSLLNLYGIQP